MKVKVKKLHPAAVLPTYATPGSACFDLYALASGNVIDAEVFRVGLAFDLPADHVMLMFSRSGHGFTHDTRLCNCVGVIDSDYRGEIGVKLRNDGAGVLRINAGDRVAQAMIIPVSQVTFEEVDELSETQRGSGGFGSSGA